MNWFSSLRMIAYARRLVVSVESIAESQRTLADLAQEDWKSRHAPAPGMRKVEISTFDARAASERYEIQQEMLRQR